MQKPHSWQRSRGVAIASMAGLALLLAACSGGSGSDTSSPVTDQVENTTDAPALTQEVPAPDADPEDVDEMLVVEEEEGAGGPDADEAPQTDVPDDARRAQDGDSVSVFYHGTLPSGEIFDSGRDRGQPLPFVVGSGQVIPGFDDAVRGLAVGDIITVMIPPARAYGDVNPDLIVDVPLDQAPEGVQEGDPLTFSNGARGVVLEISDGIVTIDANHSLAGQTLTFEIELLTIE